MPDRIAALPSEPSRLRLFIGRLIDGEDDPRLQEIVTRAAARLQAPIALVTLILDRIQLFRAQVGLPDDLATTRASDRDVSFCQFVVRDGHLFEVQDAFTDTRVPQELVKSHNIRAYLGAPVQVNDDVLGSLCVIDTEQRSFSDDDRQLLTQMAREVSVRLAEMAQQSRLDRRELQLRSTRSAFAELRNLLVVLEGSLSEARYELAQLIPVSRAAQATGYLTERVLLQQAAAACDELSACLKEAGRAAVGLRRTTIALEDVLADIHKDGDLSGALQHADDLARHLTKLVGGVQWASPTPTSALIINRSAATATITCVLSTFAWALYQEPAADGPIQIRCQEDNQQITLDLTAPNMPETIPRIVVQELKLLTTYQPGLTLEVHENHIRLRLSQRKQTP